MRLRKAIFKDWKILLGWRNDPLTRKNSFTQEIIKEENHKKWFRKNLIDKKSNLFILETEANEPVGTIKSDKTDNNSYLLSWNISPLHRKKGYGNLILNLFLQDKIGTFIAEIKPGNIASIKMVEKNEIYKKIIEKGRKMIDKDLLDILACPA